MIKSLSKEDISATPFVVSKRWQTPGPLLNFLLTDTNYTPSSSGDNFAMGINYTDFSAGIQYPCFSSGSFNYYDKSFSETSESIRNYPNPSDFYTTTSVDSVRNDDFNLTLEEDDDRFVKVESGIKIEKYIRFLPVSESKNVNGTYKRLIYDQIKNSYYSDTKDPTKLLGLENIDLFLDKSNRSIGNQIKVATLPQAYYGDAIQKGTVRVRDESQEQSITFVDDGDGNMITSGSVFGKIIKDEIHSSSLFPNLGYSVSTSEFYTAIGAPSFRSTKTKTGSIEIYKHERLVSDKFVRDKMIFLVTESLGHIGNVTSISQSDFGRSVDCHGKLMAASCTELRYGLNAAGVPGTSSAFVSIYNLDTSSLRPVQIISHALSSSEQSRSFGHCISMNDDYLVVGSPFSSTDGKRGTVYLYKSGSGGYQYETFLTGSESSDIYFGASLEIDHNFNNIVVGNGSLNNTASKVYLFESSSTGWSETRKFSPTKENDYLFFLPVVPHFNQNNTMDGFGNSVSIYCSSSNDIKIAVGAPYDRNIKEYPGSSLCMRNGAVYVFEKHHCYLNGSTGSHWSEDRLLGDYDNFHSNRFGHCVSIYENTLVVSSPKYISEYTSSYIKETLRNSPIDQEFHDHDYNGLLYVYTSSVSESWDVLAKYKPKKSNNRPYGFFANDVEIYENNLVTGDPLPLLDVSIDSIDYTFSNQNMSGSFNGGFHIFDIDDLYKNHHVGNVFYRTGTMVFTSKLNTFQSVFENGFNLIPVYDIEYKSLEKFHEKEIICTVNPGEFNFSTNPTACRVSSSALDLNSNGRFDFVDCDFILRSIFKKHNNRETWWEIFNFENPHTERDISDSSVFKYHVSSSFENKTHVSLIGTTVSEETYTKVTEDLFSSLDINDDGKTDESDIRILWRFFTGKLTPDVYSLNSNSNSLSSNNRKTYDETLRYLYELTGKGQSRSIKSEFLHDSTIDSFTTGSNLCPYVTSIGLYNGLDLIAVAKLGTPIKNQGYFPLNFIVRFDI